MVSNELAQLKDASNEAELLLLWTAKEALSKILRCGLMVPFQLLEVENMEHQAYFTEVFFRNFYQYKAVSFKIQDNIIGSIACPRKTSLEQSFCKIQDLTAIPYF